VGILPAGQFVIVAFPSGDGSRWTLEYEKQKCEKEKSWRNQRRVFGNVQRFQSKHGRHGLCEHSKRSDAM
jgi:hypothetical protein